MHKYPIGLEIKPIPLSEWPAIAEKYEAVFENAMPDDPVQSQFVGIYLDNTLIGFSHVELVYHLNAIYIEPEYRNRRFMRGAFDVLDSNTVPQGFPAIIMPDKHVRRLLTHYGYRDLGRTDVWRKDY